MNPGKPITQKEVTQAQMAFRKFFETLYGKEYNPHAHLKFVENKIRSISKTEQEAQERFDRFLEKSQSRSSHRKSQSKVKRLEYESYREDFDKQLRSRQDDYDFKKWHEAQFNNDDIATDD